MNQQLIVIDGPDGSSKSSIIEILRTKLNPDLFVFTKDPGGNEACDAIRKLCVEDTHDYTTDTLLLLYMASRIQLSNDIIKPAWQSGKHVICDRYSPSTYTYQGYVENKIDNVHKLEQVLLNKIAPMGIFIYLDVDPTVGLARSKKKAAQLGTNELRFENKGVDYYHEIRKGYNVFIKRYLNASVPTLRIDTTADNCQEFVVNQILYFLSNCFSELNITDDLRKQQVDIA